MSKDRRVIILGALSAVAEETARLLAEEGAAISLFGRDADRLAMVARDLEARGASRVEIHARNLTDSADAAADLGAASDVMGGVNAILIFYGVLGDHERAETDLSETSRIIETNFSSAAAWALAGAATLERVGGKAGVLIGVSSVAGDRGRRSNYIYGAAKGGLSILLQGIAHRFAAKRDGPRAVTVKAGLIDTPMTSGMAKGGPLWAKPKQVARDIVRAMDRGGSNVYTPWFWRWVMLVIRVLPEPIFNRMKI